MEGSALKKKGNLLPNRIRSAPEKLIHSVASRDVSLGIPGDFWEPRKERSEKKGSKKVWQKRNGDGSGRRPGWTGEGTQG